MQNNKGKLVMVHRWNKEMYPAIFLKEHDNGWCSVLANFDNFGIHQVHKTSIYFKF